MDTTSDVRAEAAVAGTAAFSFPSDDGVAPARQSCGPGRDAGVARALLTLHHGDDALGRVQRRVRVRKNGGVYGGYRAHLGHRQWRASRKSPFQQ